LTAVSRDSEDGNPRAKQITHRLLSDLFKAIDDLDKTPDEIWAGVNYFNKPGKDVRRFDAGLQTRYF
jgi:catechol 1,2-dioxygenase